MGALLITELVEDVQFLEEANDKGEKEFFIEGPFMQSEVVNRNKRMYPKNVMAPVVERYIREHVMQKRAFGELGHPASPTINLDRCSHLITKLTESGNDYIGRAKILDTPNGRIVKTLIGEGARFGVSSRGLGSLVTRNGINEVQSDFYLATAADIVADPSAPSAFVNGIMEGKEWVFVEGRYIERDIEDAKSVIQRASRKDILRVSMSLFEDFIGKLGNGK